MADLSEVMSLVAGARGAAPVYQDSEDRGEVIRPSVLRNDSGAVLSYPMRPGDPGYFERLHSMSKPEKLAGEEAPVLVVPASAKKPRKRKAEPKEAVEVPKAEKVGTKKRLVINYARGADEYMITVESAPDWDTVGRPRRVSGRTLVEIAPVLEALEVRIKNNTEEDFEP